MQNKKWIAALLVVIMCMSLFAGCKQPNEPEGTTAAPTTQAPATEPTTEPTTAPTTAPTEPPMDAQTLVEEICAEDAPWPTGAELLLELKVSMDAGYGMTMDIDVAVDSSVLVAWEPMKLYADMSIMLAAMGQEESVEGTFYAMEEDGQFVIYSYDSPSGSWGKDTVELEEVTKLTEMKLEPSVLENTVLQEQTQVYCDMECYVLTVEIAGDALKEHLGQEIMDGLSQSLGVGDAEMDFSSVSVSCVYYVEKETLLLRGITIELHGLGELVGELLSDAGASGQLDVPTFRVEINDVRYDAVEVPTISDEDRLVADSQNNFQVDDPVDTPVDVPVEDPDDGPEQTGDGQTVQEGDVAFRVSAPEGWSMDYLEGAMFSMSNVDYTIMVNGTVYLDDGATLEDTLQTYIQLLEIYLGTTVEHGYADDIDGNQVAWYSYEGVYAYMMQIPNEGGYLYLEVMGEDSVETYNELKKAVACIEAA